MTSFIIIPLPCSNNQINNLDLNISVAFPNLEVLDLSNNSLKRVSVDFIEQLRQSMNLSLNTLLLHDNPWNCDCDLIHFIRFLNDSTHLLQLGKLK